MIRWRHPNWLAAGILLIDQTAKAMVLKAQWPHLVNQGFAFGWGIKIWPWLFLVLLLAVVIDGAKRGWRAPDLFIVAGGVGNVVDRLWVGGVVDWIKLGTMWFNLSDVLISVGILWIFLSSTKTTSSG